MGISYQIPVSIAQRLNYIRTIKLELEYDGTHYYGWQRQKGQVSIQEVLEKVLTKIAHEKAVLFFASRTDAGVHARHQVASLSLKTSKTPLHAFLRGTNSMLPKDIRIQRVTEMPVEFHANRDCQHKMYRYFIYNHSATSVFVKNHAWWIYSKLDFQAMREASEHLIGEHDFSAFRTDKAVTKSQVRNVRHIRIGRKVGGLFYIEVKADGFLRHMVRNIVGLLIEVGQGKKSPSQVKEILESRARSQGGVSAPAHGLFLWKVTY